MVFFFQAEDGIRDYKVTGVQTCALPIYLVYSAELYGLGRRCDARIREAAARFGIDDALDRQVGGYSTGMKTRLALSRAVLHKPELLLFDEPTSGLDPESAHAVLQVIRDMTRD